MGKDGGQRKAGRQNILHSLKHYLDIQSGEIIGMPALSHILTESKPKPTQFARAVADYNGIRAQNNLLGNRNSF